MRFRNNSFFLDLCSIKVLNGARLLVRPVRDRVGAAYSANTETTSEQAEKGLAMNRTCIAGIVCALAVSSAAAADQWTGTTFMYNGSSESPVFTPSTGTGTLNVNIVTTGEDIWDSTDKGAFYYAPEAGDCEMSVTVPSIERVGDNANVGDWVKAGVMFRRSTYAGAPFVFLYRETTLANRTYNVRLSYRSSVNGSVSSSVLLNLSADDAENVRLRLVRRGNEFFGYWSTNENFTVWNLLGSYTAREGLFPSSLNCGLALTPNNSSASVNLDFYNVVLRQSVEAVAGDNSIEVSWTDETAIPDGAELSGFNVYRKAYGESVWENISSVSSSHLSYVDETPVAGVFYKYRVTAKAAAEAGDAGTEYTEYEVGESFRSRISVDKTNSNPADGETYTRGVLCRTVQDGEVRGSYSYFSSFYADYAWKNPIDQGGKGDRTYPSNARTGLTSLDNFQLEGSCVLRVAQSGFYIFRVNADDAVAISIDGEVVVDQPDYVGKSIFSAPFYLEAGRNYPVSLTYKEFSGGEGCQINYRLVGSSEEFYLGASGDKVSNEPVPYPWTYAEVGSSPYNGNSLYSLANGSFAMFGGGNGWTGAYDEGQLISQPVSAGDFDFFAKLDIGTGCAGLVLRGSAYSGDCEQASVVLDASGNASFVIRSAAGSESSVSNTVTGISTSARVRLSRRGALLNAYIQTEAASEFDDAWVYVGAAELPAALSGEAVVGLVSALGNRTGLGQAVFSEVSLVEFGTNASFSVEAHPLSNGRDALVSVDGVASPARDRAAESERIEYGYLWTDAYQDIFRSFEISSTATVTNGLEYALQNAVLLDDDVLVDETVNYTYGTDDYRALEYFVVKPKSTIFGDESFPESLSGSHVTGAARKAPSENGEGVFAAYYTSYVAGPTTEVPDHTEIRGLDPWSCVEDGTWKLANGSSYRTDGFYVVLSGFVTAPYSAWYRFRSIGDKRDYTMLSVDGHNLFQEISSNPSNSTTNLSSWIWLDAGRKVPLSILFHKGYYQDDGRFDLTWCNGSDMDASFSRIPVTALSTTLSSDGPVTVQAGTDASFGEWTDMQFGEQRKGNSIINGSYGSSVRTGDSMNIVLVSSSSNSGFGSGDDGHYLFRPATGDFELEADLGRPTGWQSNLRQGLMVRPTTNSGDRAVTVFRTQNNSVISQVRSKSGGSLATSKRINGYTGETLRVMIRREGSVIRTYFNGVEQDAFSAAGWGNTIYVGFAGAANGTEHASVVFLQNAAYRWIPPKPTVLVFR